MLRVLSVTCRRRKIKCDEARPACLNCRRAQKECLRPDKVLKYVIHSADPGNQKAQILQNVNNPEQGINNQVISDSKSLVLSIPRVALENRVIAGLFCHYIEFLAPWYDLNDSQNLFGTFLPQRSLNNPILFKAVIAFSACHDSKTSGASLELAHMYHAACVRDLLLILNDIPAGMQGDYLAATCLLRSYEILNGGTRQEQHLLGAYSFASSGLIDLNLRGLPQSGAWNYLREEITMALELRRPVRMMEGFEFAPNKDLSDDMWANYSSHILARVINFCFEDRSGVNFERQVDIWQALNSEVFEWRSNRPRSFDAFSTAARHGNVFPSVWLVRPWHVAGEQYSFVAEILLALSKPDPESPRSRILSYQQSHANIQDQVSKVCGLAFTNRDIAARVNVFGPLAFCGRYLVQTSHRDALVKMLLDFSIPTGWPVQPIIEDLRQHWISEG